MAQSQEIIMIGNDSLLETFRPEDYSDVGQAKLLSDAYANRLRYCEGLEWLVYQDGIWKVSETAAHGLAQKLTDLQLQEATTKHLINLANGVVSHPEKDPYLKYVNSRRTTGKISATLKEAKPMLHIDVSELDADPLILNTPGGEVHLDTGEISPHDPGHYITRITRHAPSDDGAEI